MPRSSPTKEELKELKELNVAGKSKEHPSIADYYKAAASDDASRQINYQHGLSNFSSVQFGDERVVFKNSSSHEAYRLDTERQNRIEAESAAVATVQTEWQRREEYKEATKIVGKEKMTSMEQMMRDKLQQRTKTGPFQLRKTFKYFDRDGSGGIDFDEFKRAMELMGFQFSNVQQLALFARYDESCTGEVDYTEFVNKLMESDFKSVGGKALGGRVHNNVRRPTLSNDYATTDDVGESKLNKPLSQYDSDSDLDEEDRENFRRAEVMKIFQLLDRGGDETMDRGELKILLMALGKQMSANAIDEAFTSIAIDRCDRITFEDFYYWFNQTF